MATIYDVANSAGVSPKTVSRVLNGDGPVGAKTREAVEKAMAELGYVPSNAARMMRSNRSGLIGLITGAISSSSMHTEVSGLPDTLILQGIQQVLGDSGMTLMIADTGGEGCQGRDRLLDRSGRRNLGMPGHRADGHDAAVDRDAAHAFDRREVDQRRRRREPHLHGRQQCHAT